MDRNFDHGLSDEEIRMQREHWEWLAAVAPDRAGPLPRELETEADARARREQQEWLAAIAPDRAREALAADENDSDLRDEAEQELLEWVAAITGVSESSWDPSKHPRGAFPQNPGWWSPTSGAGSAGGGSSSFSDSINRRNREIAGLAGLTPPPIKRPGGIAHKLQSAGRLASEVIRAAAGGLATGGKALVNGSATAVKNVATLGLSSGQLELIGVTDEDRANGYDTAVSIATASGEVLIAVGTGGIGSVLSKGGTVARAASGALTVFDAAGNAVGVVQGIYDAKQNGVTVANGAQIAGGALGLGANASAARGLKSVGKLPAGFDAVKGFANFEAFKSAFGAAGTGQAWHHVVEQTINSGKFAAELLHNPANLLKLPHGKGTIHAKISGFYSSRPKFAGGLTVREWLSKKPFKEQFEFGIKTIKRFGGEKYLPPNKR